MKRERDYFLKDHLGNIRIVFETADGASSSYSGSSSVTYIATMEESKAAEEDLYFANVNTTRADRPFNYPDANPANAKVSKVPGKRRGLSIMLKVMAGDTIEVSARAFYNMENAAPGRGIDVAPILGSIISSMTNPVATAVGEASRLSSNVGTSSGYSSRYVTLPDKEPVVKTIQPKSGINFVLYNTAFEVVEENTEYLPVNDKLNAIQTLSTDRMVMQEAGFIEVFVDNQANTAVYYDNMMVVHSSGSSNVLEVNAYYPYGMLMPGLSLIAPLGKYNAYKHTAKELQKELNLQWYDHGARMYDPTVSRWWVPDPLAESCRRWSPYNYAVNNPIRFTDPDGMYINDPNDYFDIYTGEYLGEDQDPLNDNVYLTTKANWKAMKGESWSSKVVGSVSPDGHSISSEVATEIFNHYYTEAGYDLSELSGNSVVPQIEGNLVRGWTDLGIAEYGSQFPGLNAGEFRISAEKHLIGGKLITKYDFINLFIHERGSHIKDFQNNEKAGLSPLYVESRDRELFERNAIRMQVTHPSWLGTSIVFKRIIRDYALSINALSASELDKYFPPNL